MSGNWHKRGNIRGADGVGVPTGGQPGQALQKVGNSDFATAWANLDYADLVGKVPKSALPDIGNSTVPVDSEAAMLNLPAVVGNMAIRTDIGKTFVLAEEPANVLENWVELVTTSDVQSVNGKTGNITLTKADVGLSNVSNTADSDKPVATQSVNGLLSKADKSKLDKATSNATASTVVSRDSSGKSKFKGVTIESAPAANTDATTKAYVDAQVSSVAGGSVLSNTDWDAMRTMTSTGVVEGWVKGCPAGGKVTNNMSAGFIKDPVWRLEVRAEGLNYATQRVTLLKCVPKFMIGFAWERIYDPAEAKWSAWTCVGGDTGVIQSAPDLLGDLSADEPLKHRNNNSTDLYDKSNPLEIRRTGNEIHFIGAMTSTDSSRLTVSSQTDGLSFAHLTDSSEAGVGKPGSEWVLVNKSLRNNYGFPVQQGSRGNRWFAAWSLDTISKHAFVACRYGPEDPKSRVWLNFSISYQAPQINTYTGPGFVPPVLDSHWGTSPI